MLEPLKRVYDYLKGVKETREVQKQLDNVLQSLNLFASSAKASEKSGKAMTAKVDGLDPPISVVDVEDLMRLSTDFFVNFRLFVSSICEFGKECNDLGS